MKIIKLPIDKIHDEDYHLQILNRFVENKCCLSSIDTYLKLVPIFRRQMVLGVQRSIKDVMLKILLYL